MCRYVLWAFFASLPLSPGRLSSLRENHFCTWALCEQQRWRRSSAKTQKCRSTLSESARVPSHQAVQSWRCIVMELTGNGLSASRPGHSTQRRDCACTAPTSPCWRFLDVSTMYVITSNVSGCDLHSSKEDLVGFKVLQTEHKDRTWFQWRLRE